MRVSVIGTGYVGLVSGVCLAEKGHEVVCVDSDAKKIEKIQQGVSPIFEPGLEPLLCKHIGGRLQATTDLRRAVLESELSLIAVGTPFLGGEIDLRFVKEVSRQIGEALRDKDGYHVVVVKSTVVPGTTDSTVLPILELASGKKAGPEFGLGMNPEFLSEGEAVNDFMNPDRIVLGGLDARTIAKLEELYAGFEGVEKLRTNPKAAEMIKYASNALLATMISFANEIGNLGAALGGIDVVDVMRGVHLSQYLSLRMRASEGAALKAYDPAAGNEAREIFRGDSVIVCDTLAETVSDAQVVILVTRWEEFRRLPELLQRREPQPLFIDGRRMLERQSFARYEGIGL